MISSHSRDGAFPLPGVLLLLYCLAAPASGLAQAPREAAVYRLGAVGCPEQEAAQVTEALGRELAGWEYFDALWQVPDSEVSGADVMSSKDPCNAFPALPDSGVLLRISGAVVLSADGERHIQIIARRRDLPAPLTPQNVHEPSATLGLGLPIPWEAEAPVPVDRLVAECARAMGPLGRVAATSRLGGELAVSLETWAPLPPGRYAVCQAVGTGRRACLTRTVGLITLGGEMQGTARRPVSSVLGSLHSGLYLALMAPLPLQWPILAVPAVLHSDPPLSAVSLDGRLLGTTPCLTALPAGTRTVSVSGPDGSVEPCGLPPAGAEPLSLRLTPRPSTPPGPAPESVLSPPTAPGPLAVAVNLPLEPGPAPQPGPETDLRALSHAELPAGSLWPSYPEPRRLAALTFDDYPSEGLSGHLLTVLRQSEVKATFFVIGHKAARMPYLLRRAVAEGHVLGNHTYDHKRLGTASWAQVHDQITRCSQVVRRITGADTRYFRPPGGQTSSTLHAVLPTLGMTLVMWDAATPDFTNPPPEQIVEGILGASQGRGRLVINLHDGHLSTIQALPELIHQLRLRGYRFVTIDELLGRP